MANCRVGHVCIPSIAVQGIRELTLLVGLLLLLGVPKGVAECADYSAGLHCVHTVRTPGELSCVEVGKRYCVAGGWYDHVVQVFDLRDPQRPELVARVPVEVGVRDIQIHAGIAYVFLISGRLVLLDLRDETAPVFPPQLEIENDLGTVMHLEWGERYAYLSVRIDTYPYFEVVDFSEPTRPRVVGRIHLVTGRLAAAPWRGLVYAMGGPGLYIIDVNDPETPHLLGSVHPPASDGQDVVAWRDYVFIPSGYNGVLFIDASDPAHPFYARRVNPPGGSYDIAVAGDHMYSTGGEGQIAEIDIRDSWHPYVTSNEHVDDTFFTRRLTAAGDLVYSVGNRYQQSVLQVFASDHRWHAEPLWIWGQQYQTLALAVAAKGQWIFASGQSTLRVYDKNRPYFAVSTQQSAADPLDATCTDQYLYVAAELGVWAYDVRDPRYPVPVGALATHRPCAGVCAQGETVFLAEHEYGLVVVKQDSTGRLHWRSRVETPHPATGVAVRGDLAYVAATDTLFLVDISDLDDPVLLGGVKGSGGVARVVVAGDHAYAAAGWEGLLIFDLTSSRYPRLVSRVAMSGPVRDVIIDEQVVYLAAGAMGVRAVDVTDPVHPRLLGGVGLEDAPLDLTAGQGFVAAGDGKHLTVLPRHCPAPFLPIRGRGQPAGAEKRQTVALTVHPNPFRTSCEIVWEGAKSPVADGGIYDLRGRQVRRWAGKGAAENRFVWDGRDEAGRRLPAGVYLARVQADGTWRSVRLVLLR